MTVTVTETHTHEINLTKPKYVSFHDGMFYRFVPDGDIITRMYFCTDKMHITEMQGDFRLNEIDAVECRRKGYKEISVEEFYSKLSELLTKENILEHLQQSEPA